VGELAASFHPDHSPRGQHLYPIIGDDAAVIGVMTRKDMRRFLAEDSRSSVRLGELARRQPAVAYPDESLRAVVYKMAESGFTRMPVVDSYSGGKLVGLVSLEDLLGARTRNLTEERQRERVLRIRLPFRTRAGTVRETP
jgi:CBS domain-containing protein